jgi:hypothetical protein
MEIVTVYHWKSGAYVNSYAGEEFDSLYRELCEQYGEPDIALTEIRNV